jgi:hypothetical protein
VTIKAMAAIKSFGKSIKTSTIEETPEIQGAY